MRDIKNKIGIIGFGNMGSTIGERIKTGYQLYVFDKDKNKTAGLKGVSISGSIQDLIKNADVLLLAVKPQDFDSVLREIKKYAGNKLIISIAAGITTKYIEKFLVNARVIRAMPNIGAKIGESVTCLCKGVTADNTDLDFTKELFYYLGATKEIDEKMMNAATAISGSGPAYIFDFIEANALDPKAIAEQTKHDLMKRLEKAAESIGFSKEDATFLAFNTTNSSFSLLRLTRIAPSELRKQVTSKGGTTEAALEIIHKGGSWEEAAGAALKRAEELSRKG